MKTRRQFLVHCSALSVGALAGPSRLIAGIKAGARQHQSLETLSPEIFSGAVNTTFQLYTAPGKSIDVTLARVTVRQDETLLAGHESFSLLFAGARAEAVEQNTYIFEHGALGRFNCFVAPVGTRDPRKIYYEMVCHRRSSQSNKKKS